MATVSPALTRSAASANPNAAAAQREEIGTERDGGDGGGGGGNSAAAVGVGVELVTVTVHGENSGERQASANTVSCMRNGGSPASTAAPTETMSNTGIVKGPAARGGSAGGSGSSSQSVKERDKSSDQSGRECADAPKAASASKNQTSNMTALAKKLVAEHLAAKAAIEDRARAVSHLIDVALQDLSLPVEEVLQRVRFAFRQLIRLQQIAAVGAAMESCPDRCGRALGVRFQTASDYPGHHTRSSSVVAWIFTILCAIALVVIGAMAHEGAFGASRACFDCNGNFCGADQPSASFGNGVCQPQYNCDFWAFDGGDCLMMTTTGPPLEPRDDDDETNDFVLHTLALAVAPLVFGTVLLVFTLFMCCCCRFNWRCQSGAIALDTTVCMEAGYKCYARHPRCLCACYQRSCCCKSCFDTFRTNTPHRHTGGVRPHMIGPFMQVVPVPISIPMAEFNYAYIIIDLRTGEVVLLDPAEVAEVQRVLDNVQRYMDRIHKDRPEIGGDAKKARAAAPVVRGPSPKALQVQRAPQPTLSEEMAPRSQSRLDGDVIGACANGSCPAAEHKSNSDNKGQHSEPPSSSQCHPLRLRIVAILSTHDHHDHSGGNIEWKRRHPDVDIIDARAIDAIRHRRHPNRKRSQKELVLPPVEGIQLTTHLRATALHTPGHTDDHYSFYVYPEVGVAGANEAGHSLGKAFVPAMRRARIPETDDWAGRIATRFNEGQHGCVFTGDCVFVGGIGALFDGDEERWWRGVEQLRRLPAPTKMFVGHEYTESLLPFALWMDPKSPAVQAKVRWMLQQRFSRSVPLTTNPTTVGSEMQTNPYMRVNDPIIAHRLGCSSNANPVLVLKRLIKEARVSSKYWSLSTDQLIESNTGGNLEMLLEAARIKEKRDAEKWFGGHDEGEHTRVPDDHENLAGGGGGAV